MACIHQHRSARSYGPVSDPASKEHELSPTNILGLVALVVGSLLLFLAWRASNAPVDQISEALTGRYTENTMWYLVGGLIGIVIGVALLLRGGKSD
jgi:uncharacterized membrane protein YdcZ (DUF606 family)